ncbi:MAG: transcription antitermination factor NusB [bacterium]
MGKRRLAREFALQILFQLDITKDLPQEGIRLFWATHEYPDEIKDFTNNLVEGTMEHLAFIDRCISSFAANWTISRMPTVDRNILRLSTYEILFRPEIPDKVSINEALEIAKDYGTDESVPFINGILDKITKEKAMLLASLDSSSH